MIAFAFSFPRYLYDSLTAVVEVLLTKTVFLGSSSYAFIIWRKISVSEAYTETLLQLLKHATVTVYQHLRDHVIEGTQVHQYYPMCKFDK